MSSSLLSTVLKHIQEHGVATAIQAIYRDLEYAKSQIKRRAHLANLNDAGGYNEEESWTMIGDEDDPELQRCIVEWEPRKSFQFGERRGRQSIDLGA
jgi:sterol 3beta-glucosyltransferase